MSYLNYSFLQTGNFWDEENVQNLTFNFASHTITSWFFNFDFINNYATSQSGIAFSGYSDPRTFDQKDVVRFLLLGSSTQESLTGEDAINQTFLNSRDYRVSFGDVINASFAENSEGQIQLINHQGISPSTQSLAGLAGSVSGVQGDIVINYLDPMFGDWESGQGGFWLLLHELGHAIGGLNDVKNTAEHNKELDSQKYTMMSYNSYGGVYASGLQLLDIEALQDTYGQRNYHIRTGDTGYSLGKGLGFFGATADDAFLYTIWDGAGVDKIDASAFNVSTVIDLRQGEFSSIGRNEIGGVAIDKLFINV